VKIISLALLGAFTISVAAQETAYQALNAVGKVKGQSFLDNLLFLDGTDGNNQPRSWRMTFEDGSARSGVREIEVRGGEIISQRAPANNSSGNFAPVNLNRLQLDSDGAFTVAERESRRQRISFAQANYRLTAQGAARTPVWQVELVDRTGAVVQTTRISADNGVVLGSKERSSESRDDYVEETTVRRTETTSEEDEPESDRVSTELKIHRTMVRTGRSIGRGFRHVGGSIQEVFTGRRTIDKDDPEE